MYPRGELDRLADRKMILQARIAVRRWEGVEAAGALVRPIAFLDRALDVWGRISPFVKMLAVPGGLFVAKLVKERRAAHGGHGGKLGMLLGALPAIVSGVQFFQQMRAARASRNGRHAPAPPP